jgi:hypothetical protein
MITYPTNSLSPVIQDLRKANNESGDAKTQCLIETLLLKLELHVDALVEETTNTVNKLSTQLAREKKNNKVSQDLLKFASASKTKTPGADLN